MSYNSSFPLSQREQYYPNDNIDFTLQFSNEEILVNSIAITGKLVVVTDDENTPVGLNQDIRIDAFTGAHALFQNITTSFNDRIVENFQHYPRYVKMLDTAKDDNVGIMATSLKACELKFHTGDNSELDSTGTNCILALPEGFTSGRSFCIQPKVCFNNTSANLGFSKTGEIKITVQLSSVKQFLFGADVDNNTSYYLTDLEVLYRTEPEKPSKGPITMTVFSNLKQIASSNNQVLNVLAPIPTTTLSCSFCLVAKESDPTENYLSFDNLPGFSRVEFVINDSNQGIIEYPIEHVEEVLLNYALSLTQSLPDRLVGRQCYAPNYITAERDNVIGVGLWYEQILQNTKMSVNLQASGVSNITQYACYMYFRGLVSF
jgi:hypothetical protein